MPIPTVAWFKDDVPIDVNANADKYGVEREVKTNSFFLVIKNSAIEADSGLYRAKASNPGGEAASEGYYTVKGYAPVFVEKPEKVYAIKDQTATFAAVVDADPLAVVTWHKGRNELAENEQVKSFSFFK